MLNIIVGMELSVSTAYGSDLQTCIPSRCQSQS